MASNTSSLVDDDREFSDWIEVFNGTPAALDLSGWHLTDSETDLDRWEFPSITLDAGGYLVVFASGKDRRNPSRPLHTNFSLDAGGEFLALVEPDGQTIAQQFSPTFGPQRSDVSFGLAQATNAAIASGDTWSYFVPGSGSLGTTWTQLAYNDNSWASGATSLGFGIQGTGFHVRRVSASGSYGQVNTLARADALLALPPTSPSVAFAATAVSPLVNFFDTGGDGHFGSNLAFPGNQPGDDDQYVVQATGTIIIPQAGVYTFGTNSDDGVRLRIDGVNRILDDTAHGPEDRIASVSLSAGLHQIEVTFFEIGGGSELELFARSGAHTAYNDGFRLVGDVAGGGLTVLSEAAGGVTTDISNVLGGIASSIYMRREFHLDDVANLTSMTLNIRYSDGLVAYLNGVEVARRGVNGAVNWNSLAGGNRPVEDTLEVERIAIGQFIPLLRTGQNMLAVQGLKSSVNDTTLLVEPALTIADDSGLTTFYFTTPTPRQPNGGGLLAWPATPNFSVPHGLYNAPQVVTIQTATPGATIRYTTDGSSPMGGTLYTGPITINRTSTLRAVATQNGHLPSDITTQTYLFLADVVTQSRNTAIAQGFPSSNINGQVLDYGMDPTVVNTILGPQAVIDSLRSLPSISLVTDLPNLFNPQSGIYVNARSHGQNWERPVSVELINPDGTEGFQIDAGLRIRGGFSRSGSNPKHAFRLFFRNQYDGPSEFAWFGDEGADVFHNMDLRTSQNYSWSFQNSNENTFEREVFSRDTERDMGRQYTRSRYYHLYINDQYWGLYQSQERAESDFAATYYGGDAEDYDVVKATGDSGGYTIEATDGTMQAWSQLWNLAVALGQNPATQANNYWTMQGLNPDGTRNPNLPVLLDVNNLIDYMLIVFYTGNRDAPLSGFLGNDRPNNWFGIYNRERGDLGFQFFQHDGEHTLGVSSSEVDRTGPFNSSNRFTLSYSNPQFLHQHLMGHPEYRLRFADRAQRHLQDGGALTPEESTARLNARVNESSAAIPAEQARWGSSSLGVPQWQAQINEVRALFQTRSEVVLGQLRIDNLYPALGAPRFNQHGGPINSGFSLVMESPTDQGTIYYTLDGSDPRLVGGGLNPAAREFNGQTQSVVLLPRGSTWKYLDTGANLGSTWRTPGFNDSSWASGPAQLGYGDGDEATTVGYAGASDAKSITTYFRTKFNVAAQGTFSSLTLRLLRDDGAVVYLNGQEVVRSNMPGTAISTSTPASSTIGGTDEGTVFDFSVPPNLLVPGQNTLAVEIHQVNGSSTDISFDLELLGSSVTGGVALQKTTQVAARIRSGSEWSALTAAGFAVNSAPASAANLRVSEINYNPYDALPQFGDSNVDNDFFEFIELINTSSSQTIGLGGVRFSAGIDFDFTGSSVQTLAPGERTVVVSDFAAFQSRYGTGHSIAGSFQNGTNLSNSGELIELVDAGGQLIQSFTYDDSGDWPERPDGNGSTLVVDVSGDYDAPGNWNASSIYGGTPGAAENPLVDVIVNEVLAHTDPPLSDSIELYNTTGQAVNIGGWWISDSGGSLLKYRVPAGTIIPAGGYRVFNESQFNAGGGNGANDFSLSAAGDDVWLLSSAPSGRPLRFADRVEFVAQLTGVSLGRIPSGDTEADLFPLLSRSLGAANGPHLPGEVIISEVNYHPAAAPAGSSLTEAQLEFVELYNRSGVTLDVSSWQLQGGVDFTLPVGTTLSAGHTIVVVGFDPANLGLATQFRVVHGISTQVALLGPFAGRLANDNDEIRLLAPTDPPAGEVDPVYYLVDRVTYRDSTPWPTQADGAGKSLTRTNADNFGDEATSWSASDPSPGSTQFNVAGLSGDYNGNGVVEQADLDLVLLHWGADGTTPPVGWIQGLPSGAIDQQELDAVLLNWGASLAAKSAPVSSPLGEAITVTLQSSKGPAIAQSITHGAQSRTILTSTPASPPKGGEATDYGRRLGRLDSPVRAKDAAFASWRNAKFLHNSSLFDSMKKL
jgi:hypothetical protein